MEDILKKKKIIIAIIIIIIVLIAVFVISSIVKEKRLQEKVESLNTYGKSYELYKKNADDYIEENIYTTITGKRVERSNNTYSRIINNTEVIEKYTCGIQELIDGVNQCNRYIKEYQEIQEEIQRIKEKYMIELNRYDIDENKLNEIVSISTGIYSEEAEKEIFVGIRNYLEFMHKPRK